MTTAKNTFLVRNMTRKELDLAIEWAEKEGWNPGIYDAEAFYTADPEGYFIGILNDEPIGVVSAISYSDNYGFVGFYIIKPEYRGKRYGVLLLNKAMQHLEGKNVGTDGVLNKQQTYTNLFDMKFAYKNIRYEGIAKKVEFHNTVEIDKIPIKDLIKYDTMMFSANREEFLKKWIKQPESYSVATTENNQLTGFGVIRKCFKGYKIGPIFADNKEYAL
ncbi:MAG: GNAT family N-acetyltransferase, partial [Vampirovibrionia bacterium]